MGHRTHLAMFRPHNGTNARDREAEWEMKEKPNDYGNAGGAGGDQ
jgi:hypothetical protein